MNPLATYEEYEFYVWDTNQIWTPSVDQSDLMAEIAEEMKYQVDIKGAGRATVIAKNEREAITVAAKTMKVHSYRPSDVTYTKV